MNNWRRAIVENEDLEKAAEAKDKRVALLISVLALFLALSEAGAKNAQHHSTEQNIASSDLYNFYQTRRIRQLMVDTAAKQIEALAPLLPDDKSRAALEKRVSDWKADAAHYEKDDANPKNSLQAILERAKAAEMERDDSNLRLRHFEYGSGALQIAIVLASASIVTGVALLIWLSASLGAIGAALMALGYLWPTLLPFPA